MVVTKWGRAACLAAVWQLLSVAAQAAIVSTFDSDADGWTTINDADEAWTGDFGNPAGSFHGIDRVNSVVWYFDAPAKFLGNQSALYGSELWYDIWLSHFDPVNTDVGDVVIRGNGVRLKWRGATAAAGAWTTQRVRLDVTGGWENSMTDNPATELEIRTALASLNLLAIRGEYRSGPDNGYLDNVALGVPEPSTFTCLLGASTLLWLPRLRRRIAAA